MTENTQERDDYGYASITEEEMRIAHEAEEFYQLVPRQVNGLTEYAREILDPGNEYSLEGPSYIWTAAATQPKDAVGIARGFLSLRKEVRYNLLQWAQYIHPFTCSESACRSSERAGILYQTREGECVCLTCGKVLQDVGEKSVEKYPPPTKGMVIWLAEGPRDPSALAVFSFLTGVEARDMSSKLRKRWPIPVTAASFLQCEHLFDKCPTLCARFAPEMPKASTAWAALIPQWAHYREAIKTGFWLEVEDELRLLARTHEDAR